MRWVGKVLHFFFPLDCYFCGKEDFYSKRTGICKECGFTNIQNLSLQTPMITKDGKICNVCSSLFKGELCEFCESRNIFFEKLFFIRYRTNLEKEILHAIKFEEKKFLSNFLRIGISKKLKELQSLKLKGLVYVPSSRTSLRKRPYLVFEPVLKKLNKVLKVPILKVLIKNSKELQSGKNFFNRFLHARFAFSIQEDFKNKLQGNYLILDDLFTTGASINECARILLENGADQVFALTLLKVK